MYMHLHTHSVYSWLDGMGTVTALVEKAERMGQPGLGLTDHGVMSGSFELYRECKKRDMAPYPGCELYVVDDIADKDAPRFHLTMLSLNADGYRGMVQLVSNSYRRPAFHRKPRVGLAELAKFGKDHGKDVAVLTGCYFGMVLQRLVNEEDPDEGYKRASNMIRFLQTIFPNLFVEVQHHGIEHDETGWHDNGIVKMLGVLAREHSLPMLATNDCHYLDKAHTHAHGMMKVLGYSGELGDVSFPGDSYHLGTEAWMKKHYRNDPKIWAEVQQGMQHMLDLNKMTLPFLDSYRYYVPQVTAEDPIDVLTDLCYEAMNPLAYGEEYEERLDYELEVINILGFADYFLLVNQYVQYAKDNDILVIARGSAGGSLVCYLLGFSQVDPIKYKLSFDRFLTPDMEKPPDIDLDIEDTRRAEVIEWLRTKYNVLQMGTYGRLGYDEHTDRGSIFVKYMAAKRASMHPRDFARTYGRVVTMGDIRKVNRHDWEQLNLLTQQLVYTNGGSHAAGFVVEAEEHRISDWIPTMLIASSDTEVTQMQMDDVEDAGFVKIDLLGLRALSVVHHCLDLLNLSVDALETIPLDDPEVFRFLRQGRAETGIFQLEGYTAAKGCREMKVRSLDDLALVNALYRPAARDSGYTDEYLACLRKQKQPEYPHDIFRLHLEETYGVPAYQDQVLSILRDMGMEAAHVNKFRTALKGKHGASGPSRQLFEDNKRFFYEIAAEAEFDTDQSDHAWRLVEGFAEYGFNRAHATAYALLGYQMAWLKVRCPLEFHAALLNANANGKSEDVYVAEARRCGIKILRPDVNESGVSWAIAGENIRRGLLSIKGVGEKAAQAIVEERAAAGEYRDIHEMIYRCPARPVSGGKDYHKDGELKGVYEKLKAAGALRGLGVR